MGVILKDSGPLRRATFRVFLHAQMVRATGDDKTAIQTTLNNNDVFNAVVDAYNDADTNAPLGDDPVPTPTPTPTPSPHPLQDFLQWLLANAPQIIAFIKMIISLFVVPAADVAAPAPKAVAKPAAAPAVPAKA